MDNHDIAVDAAKAAPVGAYLANHYFLQVTLPEIVNVLTAIYVAGLVVQMGFRFYKFASSPAASARIYAALGRLKFWR